MATSPHRAPRRRRGFSLIEVLVAIAVAAVGFLTILELFPMGFAASAKSQSRIEATMLANAILADYRRALQLPPDLSVDTVTVNGKTRYENNTLPYTGYNNTSHSSYVQCTSANLKSYVQPNPSFWYRVAVEEVTDPSRLYDTFINKAVSTTANPSGVATYFDSTLTSETDRLMYANLMVTLRRVTVYVRGPFADQAAMLAFQNNASTGQRRTGAVEVRMATYVANPRVPDTTLAVAAAAGSQTITVNMCDANGIFTANFTQFNPTWFTSATSTQFNDTGPMWSGPYNNSGGQNYLGLDNVWLGTANAVGVTPSQFPTPTPLGGSAITGEGNKILFVKVLNPNPSSKKDNQLQLTFLHPVRGSWSGSAFSSYAVGTRVRGRTNLIY